MISLEVPHEASVTAGARMATPAGGGSHHGTSSPGPGGAVCVDPGNMSRHPTTGIVIVVVSIQKMLTIERTVAGGDITLYCWQNVRGKRKNTFTSRSGTYRHY